jgi:hypothetical protein
MRKLTFKIAEGNELYQMEFITDRTAEWTEQQYMRHRNCTMQLMGNEPTEETEATSRKI